MKLALQFGLVALTVLGGCGNLGLGGGTKSGTESDTVTRAAPTAAPEQISVSSNQVTIVGPHGFCIDPTQTKDRPKSAFVVLGSCAAISDVAYRAEPDLPAILVATVSTDTNGTPIAASTDALSRFFKSEAGRAALSRDGDANTVQVIETMTRKGAFYIHVSDTSAGTLAGAGNDYWRALFNVKNRIVSAQVVGLKEYPISRSEGLDTLGLFADKIKGANAVISSAPKEKKPAISILKRFFNKDPI